MRLFHFTTAVFAVSTTLLVAQEKVTTPTVPVQVIVTVEARHDKEVPVLNREDVMVFQRSERLRVTDLVPLRGEHAGLELFILIDDASSSSLGSQLNDLCQFIESQPATTSIGIGYMRNGTVDITQNLTPDHARATKALRLPFGSPGVMPSPFLSLSDLIKRWPASPVHHEVLLVTSGIDPLGGALANPYLDASIEHAQRAGIIVYAIYTPAAGHSRHSFWLPRLLLLINMIALQLSSLDISRESHSSTEKLSWLVRLGWQVSNLFEGQVKTRGGIQSPARLALPQSTASLAIIDLGGTLAPVALASFRMLAPPKDCTAPVGLKVHQSRVFSRGDAGGGTPSEGVWGNAPSWRGRGTTL